MKSIEKALGSARKGDSNQREELIKNHRDFIAKSSSIVCRRFLSWDNDDELSIAQLAFNEAIDKYSTDEASSFYSFARMLIHNRLVDYLRKESKHRDVSLSPMDCYDRELIRFDVTMAGVKYLEGESRAALAEAVSFFVKYLGKYGITLGDLARVSPKHRDSKKTLINAALRISGEPALLEQLKKRKMLPIQELETLTGIKRRVLERGRKYLIALVLIITRPELYALRYFAGVTRVGSVLDPG